MEPLEYQVILREVAFQFPLEPVIADGVRPAGMISSIPQALVPAGGVIEIDTVVPVIKRIALVDT